MLKSTIIISAIIGSFIFFIFLTVKSSKEEVDLSPKTLREKQLCSDADGRWMKFSNACADTCRVGPVDCASVVKYSCDCGDEKCWDGEKCVP